jgi:hypothetical protein
MFKNNLWIKLWYSTVEDLLEFFYLYITDNEGEIIANITDLWGDSLKQTWMRWLAILTEICQLSKSIDRYTAGISVEAPKISIWLIN